MLGEKIHGYGLKQTKITRPLKLSNYNIALIIHFFELVQRQ